ncbi:hypothetical protein BSL78_14178 [Apostichopus japonicus]|uniref:NAD-dependent epimerase/dehydratase domain-containing protein n=1 Tax=Stichopus japonicus TaxID=307972 RepID=A0A2G8KLX4_STIJA|nr:hypothetical protein BSL78_14178 [Apostichopus japonicus]
MLYLEVLVTGASGFIAAHVVQQLLQEGYQVRGTVRSLKNPLKVDPLKKLGEATDNRLELVEADLLDADCWTNAVDGCDYVIHTASPFPLSTPSDENEIIKPAVDGTLNVLKACAGKVKRVVLTSSCAAVGIYVNGPDESLSEKDWTDEKHPAAIAYVKSKKLAEKAAWDYQKGLNDEQQFELATINPSLVLGPILTQQGGSSIDLLKRFLSGKDIGLPRICMCICDVRDVARAHVVAMTLPEAAGNRHIVSTGPMWLSEVGGILKEEFGPQGYKPTTRTVPDFTVKIGSWFVSEMKTYKSLLGKYVNYDNTRMREVLKIEPRPLKETICDMGYSLIEEGKVAKSKKYKGKTSS